MRPWKLRRPKQNEILDTSLNYCFQLTLSNVFFWGFFAPPLFLGCFDVPIVAHDLLSQSTGQPATASRSPFILNYLLSYLLGPCVRG